MNGQEPHNRYDKSGADKDGDGIPDNIDCYYGPGQYSPWDN